MTSTKRLITTGGSGSSNRISGRFNARAFSGGLPLTVEVQALVRFREDRERASLVASGVPVSRVRQILGAVLSLNQMEHVAAEYLRVDVHRPDAGRYQHGYGLALGMAMAASMFRKSIRDDLLFLGDLDLQGRVGAIAAKQVDRLNDAVNAFEIESPLTIICCPKTAAWLNSSSTVTVHAVESLSEAVAAGWQAQSLRI